LVVFLKIDVALNTDPVLSEWESLLESGSEIEFSLYSNKTIQVDLIAQSFDKEWNSEVDYKVSGSAKDSSNRAKMPHFVFINEGVMNVDPVSDSDVGSYEIEVTIYEIDAEEFQS